MNKVYLADLHIHVGISENGRWIKIPSTRKLTLKNIAETAWRYKGLDIIGIIDALSPWVQDDLLGMLETGDLEELSGGGYRYRDKLTMLLGGEVETREKTGGNAHSLLFLPTVAALRALSDELSAHIKNIYMSSQNAHMDLKTLYALANRHGCQIIPAHVFTPFKSVYGNCTDRLDKLFNGECPELAAIELGLSADSYMADRISELHSYSYLANSDAHSPDNIGREFTELAIDGAVNYTSIFSAINGQGGQISCLYGLNPALGKYHITRCDKCGYTDAPDAVRCPQCGGRIVRGVSERIEKIADHPLKDKTLHAPYVYHTPLSFLPGFAAKALERIYAAGYNELEILYKSDIEEISSLLGEKNVQTIVRARAGSLAVIAGGAGHYGSVVIY